MKIACAASSPLIPSMKLCRLIDHTHATQIAAISAICNIVACVDAAPIAHGQTTISRKAGHHCITMAKKCASKRHIARKPRWSSIQPTEATRRTGTIGDSHKRLM